MALFEIVKADGTREKVTAEYCDATDGLLLLYDGYRLERSKIYPGGTWLEVWRREGVAE